jgi:ATP-dependent DNA ligase
MADFEVMLAKNYDRKRVESWKETYVEPKLDGVRVIVMARRNEEPRYFTRNGRELGMFTHLNPSIKTLRDRMKFVSKKGMCFDTEAVGVTFGDVSGAIHTKGTVALTCRLHVFHAMPWEMFAQGYDEVSQLERHKQMSYVLDTDPIRGLTMSRPMRVLDHAQVMKAQKDNRRIDPETGKPKFEGTMVKNLHVAWIAKRTWAWMKIKDKIDADVIVTGIKEGTGKYVGMCGALICDYNGRRIRVGGMDDTLRAEWFNKPKSIIGKLIEVEAQEETDSGSLRHPRFKRVRDDK